MAELPLCIMVCVPARAMGTIGACVCWARKNGPFLKVASLPSRERVPSGKTRMWRPESVAGGFYAGLGGVAAVATLYGDKLAHAHRCAEDGDVHEFFFEENRAAAGQDGKDDRWVKVRDVVAHEDAAASGGDVFGAGDLGADAGGADTGAHDPHGDAIERVDVPDEETVRNAQNPGDRAEGEVDKDHF